MTTANGYRLEVSEDGGLLTAEFVSADGLLRVTVSTIGTGLLMCSPGAADAWKKILLDALPLFGKFASTAGTL